MKKHFIHYLIFIILAIMLSSIFSFASPSNSFTVQIPSFKVNVNNQLIDNANSEYPLLIYKGITYFPMTWNYTQALGLISKWDGTEGFSISKGNVSNTEVTQDLGVENNINANYTATLPSFKIHVNETEINNKSEEYPLLTFRNITYFPMTWRFAVDELGLQTKWNNTDGFGLNVGDSSFNTNSTSQEKYPFTLTNNQIEEAIKLGQNGFNYVRDYEDTYYSLIPRHSEYNRFIMNTQVITPYHFIMRQSAIKSSYLDTYSFEDAKDFTDVYSWIEGFDIEVVYLGRSINSHADVKAILKQGDRLICPTSTSGQDCLADTTNTWPNFPGYKAVINFDFSNDSNDIKIDFSQNAQLIIVHSPGIETIYDIDFSKIK